MGVWRISDLWREPRVALKSVRLSYRYRPGQISNLPIVAAPSTRWRRARDAELSLGGQLFVGYWPERAERRDLGGVAPANTARAVFHLAPGSSFRTEGWVILGPGVETIVGRGGALRIGSGTYVTANSQLLCRERIDIGADCAISFGVLIMDSDSHTLAVAGQARPETAPVVIGDHVWIGTGCRILKGVRIGDGTVIGAGSVVTGEIPPGVVAAGTPARVVRDEVEWW